MAWLSGDRVKLGERTGTVQASEVSFPASVLVRFDDEKADSVCNPDTLEKE